MVQDTGASNKNEGSWLTCDYNNFHQYDPSIESKLYIQWEIISITFANEFAFVPMFLLFQGDNFELATEYSLTFKVVGYIMK